MCHKLDLLHNRRIKWTQTGPVLFNLMKGEEVHNMDLLPSEADTLIRVDVMKRSPDKREGV